MPQLSRRALLLCSMLVLLCASAARGEQASTERWSVIEMGGKRVGHLHTRETAEPDGRIRTDMRMELKLARGETAVSMGVETAFLETAAGEPVWMSSTQRFGGQPVTARYDFGPEKVTITTEQNGQKSTSEAPRPEGAWTTPAATRRIVEAKLDEGAKTFSISTVDPIVGLTPVKADYAVEGPTTVEAFGKTVAAVKWRVTPSFPPGASSVEYVDREGETIRSELAVGAIRMTVLASEKEVALSDVEPAEMMASTLVRPDRPIAQPRGLRIAVFTLSLPDGELPDIPTQGAQRAERIDARTVRVHVDIDDVAPAPDAEIADESFRRPSSAIDSADPEVLRLAKTALAQGAGIVAGAPDDSARAETLRRFVHGYIDRKDLAIGLATASDVARTRQGDCTEHAALLAAMLRAAGIPSRIASGLVYVDDFLGEQGVFGYHMWTQALLEVDGAKRWVDLDATLSADTPSDATHIALSVSAMRDGDTLNSMAVLAPVLGRLMVKVE